MSGLRPNLLNKKGYYVTVSPIITADWKASSGNTWTHSVADWEDHEAGLQTGQPHGAILWQCRPSLGGSPWSMRLQLLYPHFTKEQEMEMMEKKLEQMKAQQPK